jgi:hypothetical protein
MRTAELVASDLANNIAHGVRWHDATTVAKELGCNLFLEMPPGHVLSDLAKENLAGVSAFAVEQDSLPRVLRFAKQDESWLIPEPPHVAGSTWNGEVTIGAWSERDPWGRRFSEQISLPSSSEAGQQHDPAQRGHRRAVSQASWEERDHAGAVATGAHHATHEFTGFVEITPSAEPLD